MTLTVHPPAGYNRLDALNKSAHRFALPKQPSFAFCAQLNVLPLTLAEFPVACRHYPVVFSSPKDARDDFGAIMVTGLKSGQNLFCGADGKWRDGVYIPAYVRCYPFCLAAIIEDGETRPDKLVCIDAEAAVPDGVELFTAEGEATPAWREREQLLRGYESDMAGTVEMCKALKGMGLFRDIAMRLTTANGETISMIGMSRVDEAALSRLGGPELSNLIERGWMEKIYAHLISLRNFQLLADIYGSRNIAEASGTGRVRGLV
jgi:SapC